MRDGGRKSPRPTRFQRLSSAASSLFGGGSPTAGRTGHGAGVSNNKALMALVVLIGLAVLGSNISTQPGGTKVVVTYGEDGPASTKLGERALVGSRRDGPIDELAEQVAEIEEDEVEDEEAEGEEQWQPGPSSSLSPEEFMEHEKMEYFKREGLLGEDGQPALKEFDTAFANMFPVSQETVDTITAIRELHATYPEGKPKACVMILVYPVHCGENCVAPMSADRNCTQDKAVKTLLKNIHDKFLQKSPYPIVLLHQDLTERDKREFQEATGARLFFQRVIFDEDTLPSYLNRDAFLNWIRPKHPNGDLQVPSTRIHGFGYRMMCRLFSGLLFHAPVMREFDYYIRVDGGDSRVWELSWDPFKRMAKEGTAYAYLDKGTNFLNYLGKLVFDYLDQHPEVHPNRDLLCSVMDCGARTYRDKYFYNNFEAVHMPPFRKQAYWDLFVHLDRLNMLVCNYDLENKVCRSGNGDWEYKHIGDGDFRTVASSFVLQNDQIKQWGNFPYAHPIPDWCAP